MHHVDMSQEDFTPRLIEALQDAPSQQLFLMKVQIEMMLAEPKRIMAAKASLHLGQRVDFVDFRTGQMRRGKLIARQADQATVLEEQVNRTWKISYVSITPATTDDRAAQAAYEPPPEPAAAPGRRGFGLGDKVTFEDAQGRGLMGVIKRVNRRTATLETMDGRTWRVDFELLRHVVEV